MNAITFTALHKALINTFDKVVFIQIVLKIKYFIKRFTSCAFFYEQLFLWLSGTFSRRTHMQKWKGQSDSELELGHWEVLEEVQQYSQIVVG